MSRPVKDKITWLLLTVGLNVPPLTHTRASSTPPYVNTQVCAYNGKEGSTRIDLDSVIKVKWAVILVPIQVGTEVLGAAAIGTSALIVGNQNFRELISQTDLDQGHLEILFMGWRAKLTPLPR